MNYFLSKGDENGDIPDPYGILLDYGIQDLSNPGEL